METSSLGDTYTSPKRYGSIDSSRPSMHPWIQPMTSKSSLISESMILQKADAANCDDIVLPDRHDANVLECLTESPIWDRSPAASIRMSYEHIQYTSKLPLIMPRTNESAAVRSQPILQSYQQPQSNDTADRDSDGFIELPSISIQSNNASGVMDSLYEEMYTVVRNIYRSHHRIVYRSYSQNQTMPSSSAAAAVSRSSSSSYRGSGSRDLQLPNRIIPRTISRSVSHNGEISNHDDELGMNGPRISLERDDRDDRDNRPEFRIPWDAVSFVHTSVVVIFFLILLMVFMILASESYSSRMQLYRAIRRIR